MPPLFWPMGLALNVGRRKDPKRQHLPAPLPLQPGDERALGHADLLADPPAVELPAGDRTVDRLRPRPGQLRALVHGEDVRSLGERHGFTKLSPGPCGRLNATGSPLARYRRLATTSRHRRQPPA